MIFAWLGPTVPVVVAVPLAAGLPETALAPLERMTVGAAALPPAAVVAAVRPVVVGVGAVVEPPHAARMPAALSAAIVAAANVMKERRENARGRAAVMVKSCGASEAVSTLLSS